MIIPATNDDLTYIQKWLKAEHEKSGEGFWVNWPHIERAHQQGRLIVLRDGGNAIALHTHGELLQTDSILVVHPERRGAGVGSTLAKHIIQKAREAGATLLEVDCAPEASKRFWKSLGFQLADGVSGYQRNHAYLPLKRALPLPDGGQPVNVTVQFFEANSSTLTTEHAVQGQLLDDSSIALAERVIGYSMPTSPDIEVTVSVDGRALFPKGRAKYLEAFGLIAKDGAFYLDRVLLGDPGGG
jgi:GNAT superfamily N-acetyltransferase